MQTKQDQSYGVIPVHTNESGELMVLLIEQRSYASDHAFWTFPKGHSEVGETAAATALRELKEETGITEVRLETEPHTLSYQFIHDGVQIKKTVTYFIGHCKNQQIIITDPTEIAAVAFVPCHDVRARLTHENTKVLWDTILSKIAAL